MEIKQAYSCPAFRDTNKPATKLSHPSVPGITNFELCCNSIANGVIERSHQNDSKETIATAIADQAIALMEEMEKRNLVLK